MQAIFLEKAKRNIRAAELLFDDELYDESANRAYYAAFQAALAALSALNIQTEGMSHSAVQSTFSREFIRRRKVFPSKFKSYLLDLIGVRHDADYRTIFTSKNVAKRQPKRAKDLVEKIEQELSHD